MTGGFWQSSADGLIDDLRKAGVVCLEMECSALFVLARLFGMRSGAILGAVANRETNAFGDNGAEERAIAAANEAVLILDDWRSSARPRPASRSSTRLLVAGSSREGRIGAGTAGRSSPTRARTAGRPRPGRCSVRSTRPAPRS